MKNSASEVVSIKCIGRYMLGGELVGLLLENGSEYLAVRVKEAVELAIEGSIENMKVIQYEGKYYLKGVGIRLSEFPNKGVFPANEDEVSIDGNYLEIKSVIELDGEAVGFIVNSKSREYKLSKAKVWQLAVSGAVRGVLAKRRGGKKYLFVRYSI